MIVDCCRSRHFPATCHIFTSKINRKLIYESNSLDFEIEIFWPMTYNILRLERPVETTKTGLCSVFKFLKWPWTEDRTAVTVLIGLENFRSWLVKVRSGLGLFPVLRLDLQTLDSSVWSSPSSSVSSTSSAWPSSRSFSM